LRSFYTTFCFLPPVQLTLMLTPRVLGTSCCVLLLQVLCRMRRLLSGVKRALSSGSSSQGSSPHSSDSRLQSLARSSSFLPSPHETAWSSRYLAQGDVSMTTDGDDISICTTAEMEKYESLRLQEFAHTHVYDVNLLEGVGLDEELPTILRTIGWGKLYDEPRLVRLDGRGMPQLHRTTSHSRASSHGGGTVGHDYTTCSPSGALVEHWVWGWLLGSP
jgi:hypothetical protein